MILFGNIKYLFYIVPSALALAVLFVYYILWKRRLLRSLLGVETPGEFFIRSDRKKAKIKEILIIISILLFTLVMLGPQWGEKVREVKSEGTDLLVLLDVSRSMLAGDVKPSRLARAKDAVRFIAESLKGDRIGLVIFAGDAFLLCPLTNDIAAFTMFLDYAAPESIRLQGTDIGKALAEAARVFEKKRLTSRLVLLITDGEDHEGNFAPIADKFRDMDVSIYAAAIGHDEGEFIPEQKNKEEGEGYHRDSSGKLVRTRMNAGILKKLAAATRGSYIDITESFSGLRFILEIVDEQQKNQFAARIVKERREQYQIFALILLVLIAAEVMIPERAAAKRKKGQSG